MPEPEREHYALGTTSNESLHKEFNVLFDLVHNIYAPVMRLRLRIFQMQKLLAHNRSMYAQACHQVPRAVTHRSGSVVVHVLLCDEYPSGHEPVGCAS